MADRRTPIPHDSKRACLCRNGTYSKKCCGNDYFNQGIGNITGEAIGSDVIYGYKVESCSNQHRHRHNVHTHNIELTVGSVYYLTLENNHNECYKILSSRDSEGIHINTVSDAYADCATCTEEN